jgi:hypothetical protein
MEIDDAWVRATAGIDSWPSRHDRDHPALDPEIAR